MATVGSTCLRQDACYVTMDETDRNQIIIAQKGQSDIG